MSLANLQLPPTVLQQLFKQSLVDLKNDEVKSSATKSAKLSFLGNNKKQILIVVASEEALYLPDDQLNFLVGILSACGLTMEDVAILNIIKHDSVNYLVLNTELHCKTILLFGVTADKIDLPLNFPAYQVQKFNTQVYLVAPQLIALQKDKAEKSKLWNCLKQIFSI
jgi:hypothetical protein